MKTPSLRTRRVLASLFAGAALVSGLTVADFRPSNAPQTNAPLKTTVAHADNDVLDRVADRIEKAFERDPYLKRYDLDADEDNGHIEIEGRVSRSGERDRAYNIARQHTPRRYRVINKIRVGGRR